MRVQADDSRIQSEIIIDFKLYMRLAYINKRKNNYNACIRVLGRNIKCTCACNHVLTLL